MHIHHWLYLLFIGLLAWALNCGVRQPRVYTAVIGFCVGGFLQGLTYDDWYQVMWLDDSRR